MQTKVKFVLRLVLKNLGDTVFKLLGRQGTNPLVVPSMEGCRKLRHDYPPSNSSAIWFNRMAHSSRICEDGEMMIFFPWGASKWSAIRRRVEALNVGGIPFSLPESASTPGGCEARIIATICLNSSGVGFRWSKNASITVLACAVVMPANTAKAAKC